MTGSLASVHPELIPEWSEKNLPLTPDKITFGSNKRVWWKGACGHEWETSVKARSKGEKCPICSGARVIEGINDLATLKPLLAQEWSEKNELKPTEVSVASHKKIIWKCKHGHEWEASVKSRTVNGTGCPYCSHNKVLAGFNDLASQYPDIAAEWSDRNLPLQPTMVTAFANSKAWWKCRDCGNEWYTLISTRSGGSRCPYCSGYTLLKPTLKRLEFTKKNKKERSRTVMTNGGDAAEQVVRLSLEGFEVAAKLSGAAAKNIAVLLVSVLKQEQKTKGKARLTNMIKSGKELKVFSIPNKDLKKFTEQAKRYGVLYCVLRDKNTKGDNVPIDIIARAEDASKIQRIVERFELGKVDKAAIVTESQKAVEKREALEKDKPTKTKNEIITEEAVRKPIQKEGYSQSNPTVAKTDKNPPSRHDSEPVDMQTDKGTVSDRQRKPSVKAKLDRYKAQSKQQKEAERKEPEVSKPEVKNAPAQTVHQQPKPKNKNVKER